MTLNAQSSIPRVLEVAASTRVLRERRVRALDATEDGALLGRSFVTLRGLAEHCAVETGVPISGWLGDGALARVVQGCASASPRLGELIGERPGLAGALAATLRDLRDAGIPPDALPQSASELRAVYAASERALRSLSERGLYDRVGLFRLASGGVRAWTERLGFEAAEVHGATELVGSAGDLVEALAAALPLRMFQPDWGGDFARELRTDWPWSFAPEPVEVVTDPVVRCGAAEAIRMLRTRGPRAELELVAREILQLLERGAKPAEICVVARSLTPYAAWIDSVFERFQIPYTSSQSESVLRLPAVRAWFDLVETLFGDLERTAVLRLLGSPRLGLEAGHEVCGLAEWLSRTAAVVRGDDWKIALADAEHLGAREHRNIEPRQLESLHRLLGELERSARVLRASRGFGECADRLLELGDRLLGVAESDAEPDDLARAAIAATAHLDEADAAAGRSAKPAPEEFRRNLEQALRSASWRPRSEDNGGVRILDALQARALPTAHLFLIGLQHGAWPSLRREDPFLSDELRLSLRRATGRPVPIAVLAEREERFLFGLLLSQARESVTLTRPVADSWGRALAASAFLRDLPFAAWDPSAFAREIDAREVTNPERMTPTEALVHTALEDFGGRQSEAISNLAREYAPDSAAGLSAGLTQIAATDSSESQASHYDGIVSGRWMPFPDVVSPSFLETLGNCPLKALFQRVLRVPELKAPPLDALGAADAGSLVHELLAQLYLELFEAGALQPGTDPERATQKARELLPDVIAKLAPGPYRALGRRHPTLWTAFEQQLAAAVLDFVERDLGLLLPEGVSELRVEVELRFPLVESRGELEVRGRADRIVRSPSGALRVGDYKTSRDSAPFVRQGNVKRGTALQVPLYMLAAASAFDTSAVSGEILSVPLRPERDRRGERARERQLDLETVRASTSRPLAVLHDLLRDGHFPFHDHDGCRYCPYSIACRRSHPPSARRVANYSGFARYLDLQGGAR